MISYHLPLQGCLLLRFASCSFLGSAATIIASFEGIFEEKIAAIAAFGVTITAAAVANNSTWPFVTIDQFQQRCASTISLSGCLYLQISPIVTDENRFAWLEYSLANKAWLTEGRKYQAEKGLGTLVGGDPVINTDIIMADDSGESYADPGVRIKSANSATARMMNQVPHPTPPHLTQFSVCVVCSPDLIFPFGSRLQSCHPH